MRERTEGFDGRDKEIVGVSTPFDVAASGTRSAKIQILESFQTKPRRENSLAI